VGSYNMYYQAITVVCVERVKMESHFGRLFFHGQLYVLKYCENNVWRKHNALIKRHLMG